VNTTTQPDRLTCLGRGGELVVDFGDRRVVDGPGPDLVVIELGYFEPVRVAVSEDGKSWVDVGSTQAHWGELDLAHADAGDRSFRFVRLRDAESTRSRDMNSPGADVDAVGALHTIPTKPVTSRSAETPGRKSADRTPRLTSGGRS
jgi:hypothetical protein